MAASMASKSLVNGMMEEMSTFTPQERETYVAEILNDPVRLRFLPKLVTAGEALAAYPESFDNGFRNDMNNFPVSIPLEEIKVPTMINHGDKDKDIPLSQA